MRLQTVRVQAVNEAGWKVINKSDFVPEIDVLWDELVRTEQAPYPEPPEIATKLDHAIHQHLSDQIQELADFILSLDCGHPARDTGTCGAAIDYIKELRERLGETDSPLRQPSNSQDPEPALPPEPPEDPPGTVDPPPAPVPPSGTGQVPEPLEEPSKDTELYKQRLRQAIDACTTIGELRGIAKAHEAHGLSLPKTVTKVTTAKAKLLKQLEE